MKNSKGISLIALIITIIVIIILAAIVIGGVFNTPNDAKFANFCQEYDRVQTAIQLRYYELYQKYAIMPNLTKVPTHYDIYKQVADKSVTDYNTNDAGYTAIDESSWVAIDNWKTATNPNGFTEQPKGLEGWFLRLSDGKLAYSGFEKAEADMYYTPNVHIDNSTKTGDAKLRVKVGVTGTESTSLILLNGTNAALGTGKDLETLNKTYGES